LPKQFIHNTRVVQAFQVLNGLPGKIRHKTQTA
jgi:hypothetical protein